MVCLRRFEWTIDLKRRFRLSRNGKKKGNALLLIQPGKPNQNAFVERLNRSFRDEVLDANLFNSMQRLKRQLRFE